MAQPLEREKMLTVRDRAIALTSVLVTLLLWWLPDPKTSGIPGWYMSCVLLFCIATISALHVWHSIVVALAEDAEDWA